MENFKNVLRKRVSLMGAFNALAIAFIGLIGVYSNKGIFGSENVTEMIHGFQAGIFIGLQIVMVKFIAKYQKALKDEDKLKNFCDYSGVDFKSKHCVSRQAN